MSFIFRTIWENSEQFLLNQVKTFDNTLDGCLKQPNLTDDKADALKNVKILRKPELGEDALLVKMDFMENMWNLITAVPDELIRVSSTTAKKKKENRRSYFDFKLCIFSKRKLNENSSLPYFKPKRNDFE
ncbi:hypothetical protein TNIN_40581 [Trichonephila inaurata madagascariensis]|uniref:Uncharacterized protein n=1 Tax=Trichonephila inaurata madagascariensis TaxID=2747483 RepID=A0A8X6XVE8_9ARAC|nr:hypothetical protein TNIN_40581 [Trichonephila inaurata madagascariensis]